MVDGGGRIGGAWWWRAPKELPERDLLFLVPRLAKP
jgi:hypothetical protein